MLHQIYVWFSFFFENLNCHGFVLVVQICLNFSVPYIFIYKYVNIFISALSERSVGSIGNGFFFFSLLH